MLVLPSCQPVWWDADGLRAALAVELRALGITAVITGQDGLEGETSIFIEIEAQLSPSGDCGESSIVSLRVRDREGLASRTIDFADVLPSTRARAIAMALAALIDAPRTAIPASAPASASASASASAPAPASASAPDSTYALELSGSLLFTPASLVPWGGVRSALVLRIAPPLFLQIALDAFFTTRDDPLGQVRGTWIAGSLGAGIEATFSPIRIGGRASLGIGWAALEGVARTGLAMGRTSDDTVITIDLALRGVLDIVREFAIVLELEGRIIALGLDAHSESGSVVALRDGALGIRLGTEFRF